MAPQTVPCQVSTYAVVKECVHIGTGKYYACKVINKKLMEGREHMVRNEIQVLKAVSQGNPHIVTLWDYFETLNNLYLVFDLCSGGELFDRICAKGSYYERDACHLVRVVTDAVHYLHSKGIVHRDLKPENLLFRSKDEEADLLIADFGLSRVIDEGKMSVLTTTCGTPGYMAPEIFQKKGHGKPVDIWAIGVITYFLLCGYTPFDRESNVEEIQAICSANYAFEPVEYWQNVSDTARDFIRRCLVIDPSARMTTQQALDHPWLSSDKPQGEDKDLLPNVRKNFDAKKTWKKALLGIKWLGAAQRQATLQLGQEEKQVMEDVEEGKRQAEEEKPSEVLATQE
ncbi:putative calmodulin-dependent protein kinase type 1 [Atractiella rhizophila]|nr:putative calmodulin-dependent protein kinase type 1 [Atractiella rhizophila]